MDIDKIISETHNNISMNKINDNLYLSNNQISTLNKYNIEYKTKSINELIYELEEILNNSYEELIYNFYYYFIEELDKTDLIIDEYTIITMLSGFLQNMYLSCPDEVYETIININNTIFSKPENIGKAIEEYDKESLNMVVEDYKKNPNRFNECCLLDIQLLEDVLLFYVEMRRLGFLKGKVLKNDRNE
jgi:hypothetical protein